MSESKKIKIVAIVGTTASGKTGLAIRLAKKFNGEIISADSRQVYRGLDIGTAKVTAEEAQGIRHHLIDIADVDQLYTAKQFASDAEEAITKIEGENKLPIIAGGTFFYLDILRGKISTAPVAPDDDFREEAEACTTEELQKDLLHKAPDYYQTIDTQNRRRLIRALEIINTLGYIPDNTEVTKANNADYEWLILGLQADRETLRQRYELRAKEWLAAGLLEEVQGLLNKGISEVRLQEIGFEYTLALSLLEQAIHEEQFIEKFVQKNWQYAKRQLTWLKKDEEIHWYKPEQIDDIENDVSTFLNK